MDRLLSSALLCNLGATALSEAWCLFAFGYEIKTDEADAVALWPQTRTEPIQAIESDIRCSAVAIVLRKDELVNPTYEDTARRFISFL